MRHRQLQPGQTRLTFDCSCGVRLETDIDSRAVDELTEVILEAHEGHRYEVEREDVEEEVLTA